MKISNLRLPLLAVSCVALVISGCASAQTDTSLSTTKLKSELTAATYINSTPEAYTAMQLLPTDEPLQMLNILQFKDTATYDEGNEFAAKGWTGEQAFAEYTRMAGPIARRLGAKPIYIGTAQLTLIGPEHEKWDAVFIFEYSDVNSFLALINNPEYKKHAFHRSAAVANSRLVRMTPPVKP